MIFRNKKALEQLLKNGVVATMRTYRYKEGIKILINGEYIGIVERVVPNNTETQKKYVNISGFSSVDEWKKTAEELHGRTPLFIVVVRLVKSKKTIKR